VPGLREAASRPLLRSVVAVAGPGPESCPVERHRTTPARFLLADSACRSAKRPWRRASGSHLPQAWTAPDPSEATLKRVLPCVPIANRRRATAPIAADLSKLAKSQAACLCPCNQLYRQTEHPTSTYMITYTCGHGTSSMRSNRKPLEAARLLGIGKTTVYRKLREMSEAAA